MDTEKKKILLVEDDVALAEVYRARLEIEGFGIKEVHNGEDALSAAVEYVSLLLVGIVVLRSISLELTPPIVSMPRLSGVTSSSSTSLTSPANTPPWIAAPIATTSSGLTPCIGS